MGAKTPLAGRHRCAAEEFGERGDRRVKPVVSISWMAFAPRMLWDTVSTPAPAKCVVFQSFHLLSH